MENVKKLLDEAKAATGSATDYALAKSLAIPNARVCDYYKGRRIPDEFACLQIAQATGRSFEEVTALVKVEAEKNETRREAWRKRLVQLGGIAATVAALLFAPVILNMSDGQAEAAETQGSEVGMFCIMLNYVLALSSDLPA
jgi:hypothetical protein